ncbi:MAG: response regulator [Pseudomonadales bacterium]|nr:response regulator [Pseudomonadales bacterium]
MSAVVEKVLIIDDDRLIRKIISRAVESDYDVVTAENGEEGIDKVKSVQPDFILLDVEMPGMNGYEVCDKLKQNPDTQHIPVLFLSGRTELRERMLGYEAGAADFITKPCDTEELLAKLKLLGEFKRTRNELAKKAETASNTAFTAMRGSSELGLAIQFIEISYSVLNFPELAQRFLEVTNNLGLACSLMFVTRKGRLFFSSKGNLSPLEEEVINTLYNNGKRFNDFGCRTQINYPRVALLIKNMPIQDRDAYGRYKDFLPSMLGSTDAKIKSLDTEQALIEQTKNLTSSFGIVRTTLMGIATQLERNQNQVLDLLQSMINQYEEQIPKLGLDEDQEAYLVSTLDNTIVAAQKIVKQGDDASESFQTVSRLLEHLSERQEQLLDDVITRFEEGEAGSTEQDQQAISDGNLTGDVELF